VKAVGIIYIEILQCRIYQAACLFLNFLKEILWHII